MLRESTWRSRLRQRAECLTLCELTPKESNCDRGHDRGPTEDRFEKEARSSTLNFPGGLPKLTGQSSFLAVWSPAGGFRLAWLLLAVCLLLVSWFSLCFFSEGPGLRRGTKHWLEKRPRKNPPKDRQSGIPKAVKPNSQFLTAGLFSTFWDFGSLHNCHESAGPLVVNGVTDQMVDGRRSPGRQYWGASSCTSSTNHRC